MIPIALEHAIGLERLSPLADAAIGGLLVGTFFTLYVIPTLYLLLRRWAPLLKIEEEPVAV